ncbi:hypothetical protein SAY86_031995 [Trapa natans]|uniref:Uncharacterized protein n=1 Tax=Trapa natans TaxID=22666 RepID=A0AAN7R6J9_TRANT|nr:hypothetical protein SAY86_031995 [Trapa natans]
MMHSSRHYLSHSKQLPWGPPPWPVIGCIPEMLIHSPVFRWIHHVMNEMDADIACFRLGSVHVIPVTCPKIAREFLKAQDAVFASRPLSAVTRMLSSGYVTAALSPNGDSWSIEVGDHFLGEYKRTGRVSLRTACRHYTGNLIRRLIFDRRYFAQKMEDDDGAPTFVEEEHADALFTTLKYMYAFSISDYFPFLEGLDLDGHQKIIREAKNTIDKYHNPIIEERIQKWRKNDGRDFRGESQLKKNVPRDLLDILVLVESSDGRPLLTSEEIKAQAWEIMVATVDNPSNAVEWIMAEMLNNSEIINKAVEELDRVVGKERLVQEHDIPNLNYIKACCREAFRLHPLAPFHVPHVSLHDAFVAGYHIPKGSHVILSRMGLGRNPRVWDEPLKFNPERHLSNGAEGRRQPYSEEVVLTEPDLRFISFSTGRRGCPATTLGTTMTVMLLARIIQGFSWVKPPEFSNISLEESDDELCLACPLVLCAEPRLPLHIYTGANTLGHQVTFEVMPRHVKPWEYTKINYHLDSNYLMNLNLASRIKPRLDSWAMKKSTEGWTNDLHNTPRRNLEQTTTPRRSISNDLDLWYHEWEPYSLTAALLESEGRDENL